MLSINIKKLRSDVELREQRKIKIYEKILELCYQRILNSNKQNNDYSCTYIVPNVVFGLPLYDVSECVSFIIKNLTEKEFDITFAFPTTIHISWKPIDKNTTYTNQYPIQYKNYNSIENGNNKKQNKTIETLNNREINNQSKNTMYNINQQNKSYRPIDDYSQSQSLIYDNDDISLFQNKLDNIFN